MDKLIITAALNGAEVTRAQSPAVPYTPDEIAQAALEAHAAGAAIVHVHARLDDGTPTQEKAVYARIISAVAARCDVIVQVSTGGAVGMSAQERSAVIELAPEMATLSVGSVNFGAGVFINHPADVARFAQRMQQYGVVPEIEVFEAGMVATAVRLAGEGLLRLPAHFDIVLGVLGGMPGELRHLQHVVDCLPAGCTWTAAGVGRAQLPMAVCAIVLGGHVRVGLEDNIYYRRGQLAASSAELVERVARLGRELGREVATPAEAREILGILRRP